MALVLLLLSCCRCCLLLKCRKCNTFDCCAVSLPDVVSVVAVPAIVAAIVAALVAVAVAVAVVHYIHSAFALICIAFLCITFYA